MGLVAVVEDADQLRPVGGLRAYDLANPYQPKEIAAFVPPAPPLSRAGAIQLNDVFIDERKIVYTVDRLIGGLYILEMGF